MSFSLSNDETEQRAIQTQHMVHITKYLGVCRQGQNEESGSHRGI